MSEWVHSDVGAVTLYQRAGGTPTATTDAYYGGEIPFVTIEDITNGTRYLDETVKNLSELGLRTSAAWLIKEPHILYSMYATVGKPIVNRITCATNQAIIALKASDTVEQDFLFYQLLFIRPQVYKFTSQTTQSNLNASSVRKLPIAYPKSRATQRKIATILSTIDTAIEQTEALIEKYQHIKAGLMHDLFTRGVLPNGQLRPPRDQAPELYQETAMGWIPREWSVSDCGREFAIDSGITLGPHRRPSRNARSYLRVANVHRDELRLEDLAYLEELAGDGDLPLKEKDLLVVEGHANRMEIGRCAMVTEAAVGMLFQNHLFRLRPQRLVSEFALDWLNSHHAQQYWDTTCSTSSGLNTINRKMLGRLPVLVPPTDEQIRIERAITVTKHRIEGEKQMLDKLHRQKLGLMQDLLTGKVPVTVDAAHSEAAA
jgi:type I restriction enzyme S subunit